MYGYFYINVYNNPNKNLLKSDFQKYSYIYKLKYILQNYYRVDRILYDYSDKPSNQAFNSFLDAILGFMKENDTLVVLSLFQLGNTKEEIHSCLELMRAKQVKLAVQKWLIDISDTMEKVLELSIDDLAIYENIQLYKNDCLNNDSVNNLYKKLAGYSLLDSYVESETTRIVCQYAELKRKGGM